MNNTNLSENTTHLHCIYCSDCLHEDECIDKGCIKWCNSFDCENICNDEPCDYFLGVSDNA